MFTVSEKGRRRWRCTAVLFAIVVILTITITAALGMPAASADMACDAQPPGLIGWTYSLTGEAERVDVKGDYAYLVEGSGNLQVFDISDPCNPVSIAYNNTSNNEQEFKDVRVIGDHAYVANDYNGLAKFVATDPTDPDFLKLLGIVKGGWTYAQNVAYDEGPYAFVAMTYGRYEYPQWGQLVVYDLTDFSVKQIYRDTSVYDHMWEAYAKGNRVYAAGSAFFRILDTSVLPDMPVKLGGLALPWEQYGGPFYILVEGDYAYLGFSDHPYHDGGLVVVNISNEMTPFVQGAVFIPDSNEAWIPPKLGKVGDIVFLAGSDGLYGFDVSVPSAPSVALTYPYPSDFGNVTGGGVVIHDNMVVVAVGQVPGSGHGGLAIYKLNATEINQPPVAANDEYSINAGLTLTVAAPGVLGNDSDTDNDVLTTALATDVAHGALALNSDGSFTYTPAAGYSGSDSFTYVANDGSADSNVATVSIDINYAFTGFFPPVDNPPVLNSVKAGSGVPVKFSLGGDYGLAIIAAGYPKSAVLTCESGAITDIIEETVTAGSSSLQYNPVTGQYTYIWKTSKAWAGTCRQFQLLLADGTMHTANFKFK